MLTFTYNKKNANQNLTEMPLATCQAKIQKPDKQFIGKAVAEQRLLPTAVGMQNDSPCMGEFGNI